MTLKVIGAGYGRTGTLSLKTALERLGFAKCYHMIDVYMKPTDAELWTRAHGGDLSVFDTLFEGYEASVDWPCCNLWREQIERFPEARVVLSLRHPESWYESVMATIYPATLNDLAADDETRRSLGRWTMDIIWNSLFGNRMDDRKHVIEVFERHNEFVMQDVPKEKLLVFEASDGWEPLCGFLEVDVPEEPYPRVNTAPQARKVTSQ